MEQNPITQRITEIVLNHLKSTGLSDREYAKQSEIAHTLLGKFRSGTGMNLDTLEKIVNTFPEISVTIGEVFLGKKDENNTAASKQAAIFKREAEKFRRAADALARVNLINAQTIAELTSGEVVKQS